MKPTETPFLFKLSDPETRIKELIHISNIKVINGRVFGVTKDNKSHEIIIVGPSSNGLYPVELID